MLAPRNRENYIKKKMKNLLTFSSFFFTSFSSDGEADDDVFEMRSIQWEDSRQVRPGGPISIDQGPDLNFRPSWNRHRSSFSSALSLFHSFSYFHLVQKYLDKIPKIELIWIHRAAIYWLLINVNFIEFRTDQKHLNFKLNFQFKCFKKSWNSLKKLELLHWRVNWIEFSSSFMHVECV